MESNLNSLAWMNRSRTKISQGFPYFNIAADKRENPERVKIEFAVAGFSKEQISVKIKQEAFQRILVIEGTKDKVIGNFPFFFEKGISESSFSRQFYLNPNQNVVDSELKDGILSIFIANIYPNGQECEIEIR